MADYEFSADWFSRFIPAWTQIFQQLPPIEKALEIGSFEGCSSVWLLENILTRTQGRMFCIDTWKGGIEHEDAPMTAVEQRFRKNIDLALDKTGRKASVEIIKNISHEAMVRLLADGHAQSFDFIYVDGSHQCADVLLDLTLSFMLCKVGGVIFCDDYLWSLESHGKEDLLNQPKLAIDSFVNCFLRKVTLLSGAPLYQVYFKKTSA